MHSGAALPIVAADLPMAETLIVMSEKGFGMACVVDAEGKLAGVISDGDLRRNITGLFDKTALDVATRRPKTIAKSMLVAEAVALMEASKITALVVIDAAQKPIGLLRLHDCLRSGAI
jgi:arabinose-5-phosphate isomerase